MNLQRTYLEMLIVKLILFWHLIFLNLEHLCILTLYLHRLMLISLLIILVLWILFRYLKLLKGIFLIAMRI